MRTHYRNGDEIGLSGGCDGCSPSMINGHLCHEHGCTFAWRDYPVDCFECGFQFYPQERGQLVCIDCQTQDDADSDYECMACGQFHDGSESTSYCPDCLPCLCGSDEIEA